MLKMIDKEFVRQAVQNSDLNALRVALLQATGDSEIAAIRVKSIPVRAEAGVNFTVIDEDRDLLIDKAVEYLLSHAHMHEPEIPSNARLRELMEIAAGGEKLSDRQFEVRKPALAFDPFPRGASWRAAPAKIPEGFMVAIVGAGFSGLCMAVQLENLGIPYVIFERRHEVGGTWSINTYPDARVDTPSAVYEFSFEKKYPWTEYFARQGEVREYLEHVARKYNVFDKIRFNHDVQGGAFNEDSATWELNIVDGEAQASVFNANFVLSAAGLFSTPRELDFEGVEDFRGEVVHSTQWGPAHTSKDKTVAIIGNGSTGVQLLSRISEDASHVYAFQRTPQWISPREKYGEPVPEAEQWLIDTMPYYWNWTRYSGALSTIGLYDLMLTDPEWQASGGFFNKRNDAVRAHLTDYIKTQLDGHSDLIEKVTPDYTPLARRLVIDNDWYKSLLKKHVELVTDPVERLTPTGIVTRDGKERPVDMIIASIGFSVEKYIWPAIYKGRHGHSLQDRWSKDGARAYMGLLVPDFPNFFILYGPNALNAVGDIGTLPAMAEKWASYTAQAIMHVLETGASSIEIKEEAYEAYNTKLDDASHGLVWVADEGSAAKNYWLIDGRLQVNFPWRYEEMFFMLARPDFSQMTVSGSVCAEPEEENQETTRV